MKYAILLLCLITTTLSAGIPPGQWQCMAFDSQERSYQALGMSMQHAMKAAISRCNQVAKNRGCKSAQSYCEQGPLSLVDDRCVASDSSGRSWNATGTDACKTALSLCNEWQFLHGRSSQCTIKHR